MDGWQRAAGFGQSRGSSLVWLTEEPWTVAEEEQLRLVESSLAQRGSSLVNRLKRRSLELTGVRWPRGCLEQLRGRSIFNEAE